MVIKLMCDFLFVSFVQNSVRAAVVQDISVW